MQSEARSVIESCRADANTKFVEGLASITTADLDTIEGALNAAESKIASLRSQLAEAAKVLEPFAKQSKRFDAQRRISAMPPAPGNFKPAAYFSHDQLRAVRRLHERLTAGITNG